MSESHETPAQRQRDALTMVENTLKGNVKQLASDIRGDKHVQAVDLTPTDEQVTVYFMLIREGLKYAQMRFGSESVPVQYTLYNGVWETSTGKYTDYSFYTPEDGVWGESRLHVAALASTINDNNDRVYDSHLGGFLRPEDNIRLGAVEECHHRRYMLEHPEHVIDQRANREGTDTLETAWAEEAKRIVTDLNIPVYPPSNETQVEHFETLDRYRKPTE